MLAEISGLKELKQSDMKSIKEKAEEYAKEFIEPFVLYYSQDEVKQFEAQHEDSFEAGANYVLDEIEKSLQEFSNYEDSLIISRIIEQLKK
jgi:2-oxo-4-hydroxy-4-carboxy--5-ureidoimidazoline (OHCU) decarboxylase